MLPVQAPLRRPAPALLAAVLGIVSAVVPGLLALIVLALYEGQEDTVQKWLWVLAPAALAAALVVGAVLLLRGQSWLALVVPAATLGALLIAARLATGSFIVVFGGLGTAAPLAAAVLASLPVVRSWVRSRRTS